MRDTYLKYRISRIKAFLIREKVDFKKDLKNLEFVTMLTWGLAALAFLFGAVAVYLGENPVTQFIGCMVMFAVYSILNIYKDYRRGDDIAWERKKRRRRLYE